MIYKRKKLGAWKLAIFNYKDIEMLFEMKLEYLSLKSTKIKWHELMKLINGVCLQLWWFILRNYYFNMIWWILVSSHGLFHINEIQMLKKCEIRSSIIKKKLKKKKEKKENFILPRSKLNLVSALSCQQCSQTLANAMFNFKILIRSGEGCGGAWCHLMTSSASIKGEESANMLEERILTLINIILNFQLRSTYWK